MTQRVNHASLIRILEQYLQEGPAERVAFLVNRYAKTLAKNLVGAGATGSDSGEEFAGDVIRQVVDDVDPKHGAYSEWIVSRLISLRSKELSRAMAYWGEDMSKVTEDLTMWDRFRKHLKTSNVTISLDGAGASIPAHKITDIRQLPSFAALSRVRRQCLDPLAAAKADNTINAEEVERVYESPVWVVLTPKTERAACKYGAGTRWCTAATYNNQFNNYSKQGPLYIFIRKGEENDKWQFHFPSRQFMDEDDSPIVVADFCEEYPELRPTIFEIARKANDPGIMWIANPEDALSAFQNLPDEEASKVVSGDATVCYAWGIKDPDKVNRLQKTLAFPPNPSGFIHYHTNLRDIDLTDVLDFRRSDEKYIKRVLERETMYDGVDLSDGDVTDVLLWLNQKVFAQFQKAVAEELDNRGLESAGVLDCANGAQIWDILEDLEEEDLSSPSAKERVREWLDDAYRSTSETAQSDEEYDGVMEAIASAFGANRDSITWDNNDRVVIKIHPNTFHRMMAMVSMNAEDIVTLKGLFDEYAEALKEYGELERVNIDSNGYPNKTEHAGVFNDALSTAIFTYR